MKLTRILLGLYFFVFSCNQSQKDLNVTIEKPKTEINIDSLNRVAEFSKAINGIFEISHDTVFASRSYGGLIYTIDAGESWRRTGDYFPFNDFIISDKGVLVGLYFWRGIHEPDYAELYYSNDFGKEWIKIEYDTKSFFPVKILSKPHEKLKIQTISKEVYELDKDDYKNGWNKLTFKEIEKEKANRIRYDDNHNRNVYLYTENENVKDTISVLNLFTQIDTLLSTNSFIYINGEGHDLDDDRHYACLAILNKERKLKEFKFPGSYSYMKKTDLGRVFLYNDEGVFQVKKDTLIQIY